MVRLPNTIAIAALAVAFATSAFGQTLPGTGQPAPAATVRGAGQVRPMSVPRDLVTLGMTRAEVRAKLGRYDAMIYGRPAYGTLPPLAVDPAARPTLILVDQAGKESELNLGAPPSQPFGTTRDDLQTWAWLVASPIQSLNQEQWLYRINGTYAINIVLDGNDDTAVVTDIICATLEPFKQKYNKVTGKYEPMNLAKDQLNFRKAEGAKPIRVCTTPTGVGLGSDFREILECYGWIDTLIPFSAAKKPDANYDPLRKPKADDKGVGYMTTDPFAPSMEYPMSPGINDGVNDNTAVSTGLYLTKVYSGTASDPILGVSFTRDCVLTLPGDQPDQKIILTMVNYKVVRAQTGAGAVIPTRDKAKMVDEYTKAKEAWDAYEAAVEAMNAPPADPNAPGGAAGPGGAGGAGGGGVAPAINGGGGMQVPGGFDVLN